MMVSSGMEDHNRQTKQLDLIVRNGMLVIPGVGQIKADVGIADGKIATLGANLAETTPPRYTMRPAGRYFQAFSTHTFISVTSSLTKAKPIPKLAPPFSAALLRSESFCAAWRIRISSTCRHSAKQ